MAPEDENRIIVQCMRERMPLPKKIQDAPELRLGLELYFGAFFDLNTCRQIGMGLAPIPWNCIKDYAQAYEFDESQTDDLFYFIRKMDHEYLKFHNRKTQPSLKKPHGKSGKFQ